MTLGLSQITNDAEATIKFLGKYGQYFDKWFITVADKNKKQYNLLAANSFVNFETLMGKQTWHDKLELSYYKWTDDFAAARNHNLKTIDTAYWFWADSDDELENPERLPELLKYMAVNNLEVMQLKYDYAQNEQGDAISDHWRERLIKSTYRGKWSTPVHEILQGPPAAVEKSEWITVKHNKDTADITKSMERNKKILEKHFEDTKDPRDAYYLGMTALGSNKPDDAIQWFLQHIKTSGWDEDQYRSWCRIAEAEYIRDNHEQSLYATDEAIKLKPEFPDAYYIKVLVYGTTEHFDKAIEWLKVAMSKPEPDTMSIVDPTLYKYRGMAMGAQCYLFSGRIKEAHQLYQVVMGRNDKAFEPEMQKLFEEAYFDDKAIGYLKWLLYYTGANGGKPLKLFESIAPRLFADSRLNAERVKFLPKVTWPKKSIAFFCGGASEPWGPDTLDKGMGGSEEAIVYLSRELAKQGWVVTVFNDREEEYKDDLGPEFFSVNYKPWTLLNPYDEFDVFVAWRMPENALNVKARQVVVDLHDTIQADRVYSLADKDKKVKFFVKSNYHRELYPELPDERFVVVGNGIERKHFND